MDGKSRIEAEFIDRLYAVAMEPERFTELVEVWQDRLNRALADGSFAVEAEIAHLESHVGRAQTLLEMADDPATLLPRPIFERMEAEPHPMIAIDAAGIVRAQNSAAQLAFGLREDQPANALPFDRETLAVIADFASAPQPRAEASRLLRGYRADDRPLLLSLAQTRTASSRALALLRVIDFTWPEALTPLVREAFGLTQAESDVLRMFAEGHGPADIARQRGASLPTVRTQIRTLYEKTGTRNQAELIRMAIGLGSLELARDVIAGEGLSVAPHIDGAPFPRPEHRHLIELPDGRIMEYSDFGAPDGRTCLFLHTEFYGDVWPVAAVQRAFELRVRIVAPLRPFYGRSDAGPHGRVGPSALAGDVVHLLDRLGIDRAVPMFQMAGGLTAAELARLYPQRIAALVPVAPMFPMGHPEDENQLTRFHNFLSSITHRHPRLLEFMARSGFAYLNRVGARRFFQTFAKGAQPDIDLLEDDATFAIMARGADVCAVNGHRAFLNDYHAIPPAAERSFFELDRPFVAVIGDAVSERRNRRLENITRLHPRAERIVARGGAHYLHFSHPRLMAEAAARAWELA